MPGKKVKVGGGAGGRRMTTWSMANHVKEQTLMNHLVMETVFNNCSVKDLKAFRQVCPQWRDFAWKKWNQSVKLRISLVREWSADENGKEKYKRFLQMVEGDLPLEPRLLAMWTTFFARVKTLELLCVIFPSVQSVRNALFHCFPNLESLTLNLNRIVVFQTGHISSDPPGPVTEDQQQVNLKHLKVIMGSEFPLSWMEVLSHFPSLEKIDVEVPTVRMQTEGIFQAINTIREEDSSKLNLKHISIRKTDYDRGYVSPAALATLMDRRLQLESLELFKLNERRVFRDILQIHADTLKMLTLTRPVVPFWKDPEFPQLTQLQELRMTLHSSLESIEFLEFTPNLKKLKLMSYSYPRNRQVPEANFGRFPIMLNACKDLEVDDPHMSLTTDNWKSLMEWTPNLESLKIFDMDVDNVKFAMICEGWTNLVELHMKRSKVDGSGITGWDEEDIQSFDSLKFFKGTATLPGWRPITVPRANITALKHLQIIKMTTTSPIKLSRAAGLHGIEMLPDLRRLCIQDYKIMSDDRDYWKKLFEKYPYPE